MLLPGIFSASSAARVLGVHHVESISFSQRKNISGRRYVKNKLRIENMDGCVSQCVFDWSTSLCKYREMCIRIVIQR
jgi:hypothetical protein